MKWKGKASTSGWWHWSNFAGNNARNRRHERSHDADA
jgi:hypothetical protein